MLSTDDSMKISSGICQNSRSLSISPQENIERMSKYHQLEILRKLSIMEGVNINENNNGTFINLTEQSEDVILILEKYSIYVNEQQQELKAKTADLKPCNRFR